MASTSVVILGPPSTLRRPPRSLFLRPGAASLRAAPFRRRRPHCIADLSRSSSGPIEKNPGGVEQDPIRLWYRYVDWLYHHKDLNLSLDVSRIGFTDEFVKRMEPRFEKVIQVMQKLEKDAITYPDERRMVGHYWLRSPKLAPTDHLKSQIESTLKDIRKFADDIVKGEIKPPSSTLGRFTQILCIGIGGSAIGPQFVAEALAPETRSLKIRFIDSTDPAGIDHQIAQIGGELASTLVIVISKTGAYPETQKRLLEVQGAFQKAGLDFPKQAVAITQESSLLDKFAKKKDWLKRFPMFDWVGGRHSVMSAAGLLPAALQGIKIDEILKGAELMDEETRRTELRKNPAALLAMCWYWASKAVGSKDTIVLPYEDSFLLLRRYLQQLVMESLGKEFDLNGIRINEDVSVPGNKGSTDQHAYFQQLRDGARNFFVTFIKVLGHRSPTQKEELELEPGVTFDDYWFGILQSTRSALYANNRESITVTVNEVNPTAVGALIALYERAVGIYASLLNINAYPDPDIEAGKRAAGEVLALQKTVLEVLNDASCNEPDKALSLKEIADRCNATKQIEIICNIIEHLAADERVIIGKGEEGNFGSPQHIKVRGVVCERK